VLVGAATLIPFVVMGDVAGNEITQITAAVMLGGLLTATLLNQVLVPAMCLALGPREPIAAEPESEDALDPTAVPAPPVSAS
jgi:Cu/Ag efflux pump CusA